MNERASTHAVTSKLVDTDRGFDEAIARYESAASSARSNADHDALIASLTRVGQLYARVRRFEDAHRVFNEAFDVSISTDDLPNLLRIELEISKLSIQQGEQFAARAACERARVLVMQTRDVSAEGDAEFVAGRIARVDGDVTMAEIHFLRAEELALQQRNVRLQAETSRELAAMYRWNGRPRETLRRMTQAHRLFALCLAQDEAADTKATMTEIEHDLIGVAMRWAEQVESRNPLAAGHCARVTDLACALWERVGTASEPSPFWFRAGAILHDIGNDSIPDEVLTTTAQLDEAAWTAIRQHPLIGVQMLADIDLPATVLEMVQSHHERWDGSGYPLGLAGEQIPVAARVLFLTDVYDALTNARSYKQAFSHEDAMEILRGDTGRAHQPALFAHFEEMMMQLRARMNDGEREPERAMST